jgi:phosphatidylinositol 4-kinase
MRDIRARALEKIASLSATGPATSFEKSDLDRLCKACHSGGRGGEHAQAGYNSKPIGSLGRVPMVSKVSHLNLHVKKLGANYYN